MALIRRPDWGPFEDLSLIGGGVIRLRRSEMEEGQARLLKAVYSYF